MLKKCSAIVLIVLITCSFQSQCNKHYVEPEKPVNKEIGVNRADLITYAKKYMGTTYRPAGIDPAKGFDCSGFVYFVFKNFRIALPRSSREYETLGTALKPEEFQVGDVLVFYGYADNTHIGHVGIICEANGMKSRFIHSSSGKAYGITISELGSKMYTRRFYKCIDVIHSAN
jgi:cell wall-associated NlpC family hydrolase